MSWEMASVRVIFIISVVTAAYHLRPFHWSSLVSSIVGAALACAFVFIEMRMRKASLKRLIGAVDEFMGGTSQYDDMSLLVVKRV